MSDRISARTALHHMPLRFVVSAWPVRALVYVITNTVVGPAWVLVGGVYIATGIITSPFIIGVFLLRESPLLISVFGESERLRLRLLRPGQRTRRALITAVEALTAREYLRLLRDSSWGVRELAHLAVTLMLWPIDIAVLFCGPVVGELLAALPWLVADGPTNVGIWTLTEVSDTLVFAVAGVMWFIISLVWAIPAYAIGRAEMAASVLHPGERDAQRQIDHLRASRLDLVAAFAAERSRIESRLHDGVQQRLVALTMTLGIAEQQCAGGPLGHLLDRAHREADAALADLRDAVRGISPRVLADHGLAAATEEIAARTPLPVTVSIDTGNGRLNGLVEDCSYFMVSEAVANACKHAHAGSLTIVGRISDDTWDLRVIDDGIGGADAAAGQGISGLSTRCAVLGGRLDFSSPPGGPTELRMTCPLDPHRPRRS